MCVCGVGGGGGRWVWLVGKITEAVLKNKKKRKQSPNTEGFWLLYVRFMKMSCNGNVLLLP